MSSNRCVRALTFIEVLVVMGVLSVTMVILIPNLNRARQKSRQSHCAQNIRNLTNAVIQYEALQGYLPPAGFIGPEEPQPECDTPSANSFGLDFACFDPRKGAAVSWIVLVLPYLGYEEFFDEFDLSVNISEYPANPQARTPSAVKCPAALSDVSTPNYKPVGVAPGWTGVPFAKGNYAAFVSPVHANQQRYWQGALGGYVPGQNRGQPLAAITDGLGSTLLVTEVRAGLKEWDIRGVWSLAFPGATAVVADLHPENTSSPSYVPADNYDPDDVAVPNSQSFFDIIPACFGNNRQFAASVGMPCGGLSSGSGFWAAAPRSRHPDGVNASFLDGRVTFLSNDIDIFVYAAQIYTRDTAVKQRVRRSELSTAR